MIIIGSIVALILGMIAFIIIPQALRNFLKAWLEEQWVNIQSTAILVADKVSEKTGDVIAKLPDLADQFWTALTTFVKRLLYVIVADLLILVALIVFDYHAGIIGWSIINALIALIIGSLGNSWSRFILHFGDKKMDKLKRNITKSFMIIFFIMAVIGAAEFAIPGIFKYGSWVIASFFWILILTQGWSVYKGQSTGYKGGVAILTFTFILLIVGVFNNIITEGAVTKAFMEWDYAKKVKYSAVIIVDVIKDMPVFTLENDGTPVKVNNKVLTVGSHIEIPASERDYLKEKLPIIEYQRRRLIQFVEPDANGFYNSDGIKYYTFLDGTKIHRKFHLKSVIKTGNNKVATVDLEIDSTVIREGYKEHVVFTESQLQVGPGNTIEVTLSPFLVKAGESGYPVRISIDGINHVVYQKTEIFHPSIDLKGQSSMIQIYTPDNRYLQAVVTKMPNGVLCIKLQELRGSDKKYGRTMVKKFTASDSFYTETGTIVGFSRIEKPCLMPEPGAGVFYTNKDSLDVIFYIGNLAGGTEDITGRLNVYTKSNDAPRFECYSVTGEEFTFKARKRAGGALYVNITKKVDPEAKKFLDQLTGPVTKSGAEVVFTEPWLQLENGTINFQLSLELVAEIQKDNFVQMSVDGDYPYGFVRVDENGKGDYETIERMSQSLKFYLPDHRNIKVELSKNEDGSLSINVK